MATKELKLHRYLHKALRKKSAELLVALGQADFSEIEVRSRLIRDATGLLRMLSRHDLQEEAFVHPYVARVSASIADQLDVEHCERAGAVSEAKGCLNALQHAPRREIQERGHALYLAFARVLATDLLHMDYEERQVQPRVVSRSDDPAIWEMDTGFLSQLTHEEVMEALQTMLPALNSEECARVVGGIRAALPHEISSSFVPYVVQPMLKPMQYRRLLVSLDNMTAILAEPVSPSILSAH